jgi:hypothetical protein
MVGGGVRGKGGGIVHDTMTQVGPTMEAYHLFIEEYPQAGEMTIGTVAGEDVNGTTSKYPTNNFNEIGVPGKRADIGRSKIPGVSRV